MDVQQGITIFFIACSVFLSCVVLILLYLRNRAEDDVHDAEYKLMEEQIRGDGLQAKLEAQNQTVEEHRDRIRDLIGQLHAGTNKPPEGGNKP